MEETETDDGVVLRLTVAKEDVGKVIGKQGRIARARGPWSRRAPSRTASRPPSRSSTRDAGRERWRARVDRGGADLAGARGARRGAGHARFGQPRAVRARVRSLRAARAGREWPGPRQPEQVRLTIDERAGRRRLPDRGLRRRSVTGTAPRLCAAIVLEVPAAELPELDDDEFYPFDLVGPGGAGTAGGAVWGRVADVVESPAHPLLVVALDAGEASMTPEAVTLPEPRGLVPFVKAAVPIVWWTTGFVAVEHALSRAVVKRFDVFTLVPEAFTWFVAQHPGLDRHRGRGGEHRRAQHPGVQPACPTTRSTTLPMGAAGHGDRGWTSWPRPWRGLRRAGRSGARVTRRVRAGRRVAGPSISDSCRDLSAGRARSGAAVWALRGLRRPGGGSCSPPGPSRSGRTCSPGEKWPLWPSWRRWCVICPARWATRTAWSRSRSARDWRVWSSTRTTRGRGSSRAWKCRHLLSGDHGAIARWRRENARPSPWQRRRRRTDCRRSEREAVSTSRAGPPTAGPRRPRARRRKKQRAAGSSSSRSWSSWRPPSPSPCWCRLPDQAVHHPPDLDGAHSRGGRPHPPQPADLSLPRSQERRCDRVPFAGRRRTKTWSSAWWRSPATRWRSRTAAVCERGRPGGAISARADRSRASIPRPSSRRAGVRDGRQPEQQRRQPAVRTHRRRSIIGKAFVIYWPIGHWGGL